MSMTVIGSFEDVVGFRLAGVHGAICETAEAVERAIEGARGAGGALVVAVSASAADMASEAIRRLSAAPGFPLIVVLPSGDAA
jgi:vacuolar-type H+-ATPase subunit F/Vma7